MAIDIYLTIPGIDGESTNQNFPKAMEVYSYSWGVSNPTTIGSAGGAGGGAGKPHLSDLSFMKKFDAASPLLFQACVSGKRLSSATLSLIKVTGASQPSKPFLVYEFADVFITSVQDSASSGGDDAPAESVSFAYGKIEIKYTTQNQDGSTGTTIIAGWDLTKTSTT